MLIKECLILINLVADNASNTVIAGETEIKEILKLTKTGTNNVCLQTLGELKVNSTKKNLELVDNGTNRFTVNYQNGNTVVGGTLGISGTVIKIH